MDCVIRTSGLERNAAIGQQARLCALRLLPIGNGNRTNEEKFGTRRKTCHLSNDHHRYGGIVHEANGLQAM